MHGTNRDPWEGLRGNLLLQSLSAHAALTIAPWLRRVHLPGGLLLPSDEAATGLIYFPETMVACLGIAGAADGYEIAVVGREGAIGYETILGAAMGHCGRVQPGGGTALALPVQRLIALRAQDVGLADALLRFGQVLAIQMACTLVSNLRDTLESRIARWLLMFHDRHVGDELAITHHALACLLHVRRATVTEALHILEGDRVLRCTRGHILIRDRAALEARAGTGYGAAERSYRTAIGPFGRAGGVPAPRS